MLSRYRETIRVWTDPVGRLLFRLRLRPNHLTLMGFGVSLLAAAAFMIEKPRTAGFLLILAGLFDFFDGSLARASGQVTAFGAFLDSVIDRYSDLVIMLGIVVMFARAPHPRGALVAMAGLVGSMMVSYTKARAESMGITCNVGFMERPERMICLIAGAILGLMEPALWVLAILSNVTALHRIVFTRRAVHDAPVLRALLVGVALLAGAVAAGARAPGAVAARAEAPAVNAADADTTKTPGDNAPAGNTPGADTPGANTPGTNTPGANTPDASAPSATAPGPNTHGANTPAKAAGVNTVAAETERAWREAVLAYQEGDATAIIKEFGSEAAYASPIRDYLGYVLAEAYVREDDLAAARAIAAGVVERHRESRLAPAALLLAATVAMRQGDEVGSQRFLAKIVESYPDCRELPEVLYLLGMSAEARGQMVAAVASYRELMVLAPTTGWADGATDRLEVLARNGARITELTPEQRLARAERLLRGGVPKTAADEAEQLAKDAREPGIILRALRIVADGAERLGHYDVAARTFGAAVDRASATEKPRLLLRQARAFMRTKKPEKALDVLARVVAPESDAAEALYLRARVFQDLGRHADAMQAYRTVATKYGTREVAAAALWNLGWQAYLKGDLRAAETAWRQLGNVSSGRPYRPGALYWAARATEQTAGRESAERLYATVLRESPRSYYGILAARRTGAAVGNTRQAALQLPANPRDAVANDPAFARVDLLRRIGLVEYAWQELEDVVQRSFGDPVRLYGLSAAYIENERYHLALRILRGHFAAEATTGDPSLPTAFWQMFYPFGWRSSVTEAAERYGLDPFFVAAIVREESSFYPRAVSRVGARGLMQLMPRTARLVGESFGFSAGDVLDDPEANIQLGTKFLADLLKDFGDPRLAAAAYNAGPGRVRQWWKTRRTDDIEAFVEQIPFDETRQYVKKVMLSWAEYQRIYGGK